MPTHKPLMRSSANGVSITRSGPKRCCSPTVARNTPPLRPTSSPNTMTLASSCMALASARLTASTRVTSGMESTLELVALGGVGGRQVLEEMIKHGFWCARPRGQVARDGRIDLALAIGCELLLLGLPPGLLADQVGPQPRDGLLLPAHLHFLRWPIARSIVGGRVVPEAIGERFDEARSRTPARLGNGLG